VPSDPRLKHQVCFALYSASRAVTAFYRPVLESLGLTYPQYLVMMVLWEHGERSVRELGTALMLDSGTLSPLLKRLEAAGLVIRRRDPTDERSVLVRLTGAGNDLRRAAADVPMRVATASGLPPSELAELRDALTTLTHAMLAATSAAHESSEESHA
jgi:MarR family transcriptional regulator, organic hydroperoxide resistance regulator